MEPAKDVKSKDGNLVFVAGATGKVGSRTVRLYFFFYNIDFRLYKSNKPAIKSVLLKDQNVFRELLKLGFKVRAGVRSAQRAQPLVKVRVLTSGNVLNLRVNVCLDPLWLINCSLLQSVEQMKLENAADGRAKGKIDVERTTGNWLWY